jgi:hypothetical protein
MQRLLTFATYFANFLCFNATSLLLLMLTHHRLEGQHLHLKLGKKWKIIIFCMLHIKIDGYVIIYIQNVH